MRLAVLIAVLASVGTTIHAQSHGGSQPAAAEATPAPKATEHGAGTASKKPVSASEAVARIADALKSIGQNTPQPAAPQPRASRPAVRPAVPRYRIQWRPLDQRWRIVWADRDRVTLIWNLVQ